MTIDTYKKPPEQDPPVQAEPVNAQLVAALRPFATYHNPPLAGVIGGSTKIRAPFLAQDFINAQQALAAADKAQQAASGVVKNPDGSISFGHALLCRKCGELLPDGARQCARCAFAAKAADWQMGTQQAERIGAGGARRLTPDEQTAVDFYGCNPSAALFDLRQRLKPTPTASPRDRVLAEALRRLRTLFRPDDGSDLIAEVDAALALAAPVESGESREAFAAGVLREMANALDYDPDWDWDGPCRAAIGLATRELRKRAAALAKD